MQLTAGLKLNCRTQAQGLLHVISDGQRGKGSRRPIRSSPSFRRHTWLRPDRRAVRLRRHDWVVVGPTGAVETKRQQEKKIKDKSLVFEAIDPKEVKVRVHGDAAIVMGLYHIKATLNGRTVDGVFRNTGVFTKQAGTWRCVFNQVTPVAGPPAEQR
jgi:Domain of unknown function (DUF4440)